MCLVALWGWSRWLGCGLRGSGAGFGAKKGSVGWVGWVVCLGGGAAARVGPQD